LGEFAWEWRAREDQCCCVFSRVWFGVEEEEEDG